MRRLIHTILIPALLAAQMPQNPSPMVEHTRPHPRVREAAAPGARYTIGGATLYVPHSLDSHRTLMVFFHGGTWLPEIAASENHMAVISAEAAEPGQLLNLVAEAPRVSGLRFNRLILGCWSGGCQTIRAMLPTPEIYDRVNGVLCIDGMHTAYTSDTPDRSNPNIDTSRLDIWVQLAKDAVAGKKRFVVTHSEVFPGTYASTTETADYLLGQLRLQRREVLKWGPMRTQQLSEAEAGRFLLVGYAGNSAPDHVDQLHSLPAYLKWMR